MSAAASDMSVYLWTVGLGLLSHVAAGILLRRSAPPDHQLFVAAGVLLGVSTGWLWEHRHAIFSD